jgi:HEAT repeat protein
MDCAADPSDGLRLNAAVALRGAPPAATAEAMEALLEDPNPRVRIVAAGSVLAADPEHAAARSVVETGLSDPSPRVREAAEELFKSLDAPPEDAVLAPTDLPTSTDSHPVSA